MLRSASSRVDTAGEDDDTGGFESPPGYSGSLGAGEYPTWYKCEVDGCDKTGVKLWRLCSSSTHFLRCITHFTKKDVLKSEFAPMYGGPLSDIQHQPGHGVSINGFVPAVPCRFKHRHHTDDGPCSFRYSKYLDTPEDGGVWWYALPF